MATSRLSTRRVEWRVQVGTSNKPGQGLVIFEASVSYIPDPLAAGGPRTAIPEPVAAVLDGGGYACTPDPANPAKAGERGVSLFTTDSLGADGGDWTWTARPQLRSVSGIQMAGAVPAFSFTVPTGAGSLDLAEVQKVPASPGLGTEQALALVLRAEQAAQTALNAVGDTVAEAAAAAVTESLDDAGVMRGATPTLATDIAFAITDAQGRRSWMEATGSGRPTSHALELLFEGRNEPTPIPETSGYAFAVTDTEGRVSELAINNAGEIVGAFPARMEGIAKAAATSLIVPGAPITCWGHSLVEGGWPTTLAAELGVSVLNYGIGGQGMTSVAARQGGVPALATLPSDRIPASGGVTLTNLSAAPYTYAYNTGTSSGHGSLAGVPGTLTRDNPTNVHTFTRDTAGTAVWCPPKTPWVPDNAVATRGNLAIIMPARNSLLYSPHADLMEILRRMVAYMSAPSKRFLILEEPPMVGEENGTANRATLNAWNDMVRAEYPHQFTPVAAYLRGPALAAAGITPTAQDNNDIAKGITPASLRSDGLHWNAAANVVVGKYLATVLRTNKGWV